MTPSTAQVVAGFGPRRLVADAERKAFVMPSADRIRPSAAQVIARFVGPITVVADVEWLA
jgi:hypothetical protein